MSTSCIFAFGGRSKSGKTTLGKRLALELGVRFASFGDFVRKEARRRGLTNVSSPELQDVGLSLVTTDLSRFCESVLADAGFVPGEGLVIDGVRHLETIRELKRLTAGQNFKLVYLESSLAARHERAPQSVHELENLDLHPVDSETASLKDIANLVLDTSFLTAGECHDRLRVWAESCT
jgi:adenylate kinase family enzyme